MSVKISLVGNTYNTRGKPFWSGTCNIFEFQEEKKSHMNCPLSEPEQIISILGQNRMGFGEGYSQHGW